MKAPTQVQRQLEGGVAEYPGLRDAHLQPGLLLPTMIAMLGLSSASRSLQCAGMAIA